MKKFSLLMLVFWFCFLGTQAIAQEHFTPGPVWRVILIDIKPGKFDEFMTDLRRNFKPINEEYKKQGIIVDYLVHLKTTIDEPGDWDVALAVQYKNFATLDDLGARTDPITLKHYGSREARQAAGAKRTELGTTVASFLMRQIALKDMAR